MLIIYNDLHFLHLLYSETHDPPVDSSYTERHDHLVDSLFTEILDHLDNYTERYDLLVVCLNIAFPI